MGSDDPARNGSRGAGFSVSLGVTSRVRIGEEGFPGIDGRIDGRPEPMATTRRAVQLLLGDNPFHVDIDQRMELPVSQGFGMSSAGALSATLAVAQILSRPRSEAVWAAHCAEVVERTGLGDVVGAARGGFEMRLEPGLEPTGRVEALSTGEPVDRVLLAVVDEAIHTKKILGDAERQATIAAQASRALAKLRADPSLQTFVVVSQEFSMRTQLASQRISDVYADIDRMGHVSQCMLGGSVFVFGRDPSLRQRLSRWGTVHEARIDLQGARVLPQAPVKSPGPFR